MLPPENNQLQYLQVLLVNIVSLCIILGRRHWQKETLSKKQWMTKASKLQIVDQKDFTIFQSKLRIYGKYTKSNGNAYC